MVTITNQMKKKRRNIGLTPFAMIINGGFGKESKKKKKNSTKPSEGIAEKRYEHYSAVLSKPSELLSEIKA